MAKAITKILKSITKTIADLDKLIVEASHREAGYLESIASIEGKREENRLEYKQAQLVIGNLKKLIGVLENNHG